MSAVEVYPVGSEVRPLTDSMSVGHNSFYHHCDHIGYRQGYAICLQIRDAYDRGVMTAGQYTKCQKAFKNGTCPAMAMRQKEVEAGRALFYVHRVPPKSIAKPLAPVNERSVRVDVNSESYKRGRGLLEPKKGQSSTTRVPSPPARSEPKPAPRQSAEQTMDFGALATQIAREEQAKRESVKPEVVPAPAPAQTVRPLPGETPLQFARRRAQLLSK